MIDFLASDLWIGWALIMLFGLTLWQCPAILHEVFDGSAGATERAVQPGEDPPHLGIAYHVRNRAAQHRNTSGTDRR